MAGRLKRGPWAQALIVLAFAGLLASCMRASAATWPGWEGFRSAFVSDDGRVVDHSQDDLRTVSEGQAYALFFALVANDRPTFDRLLTWTENNLSDGSLDRHLPAWHWGRKADGQWGVIDPNSASDADLWMAYTLLEASRLWCHAPYAQKAQALGRLILDQETLEVDGLGLSLLPGRVGFVQASGQVKLNPSYVPGFQMARLAQAWADEPRWARLYLGSQRLVLDTVFPNGVPDWVVVDKGVLGLPPDEARGDYDAIRAYLWIGMTAPQDPVQAALLARLKPWAALVRQRGHMPEWFEPNGTGVAPNAGPAGFQVAVAPVLRQLGLVDLAKLLERQGLRRGDQATWRNYGYYNSALTLFAQSHLEGLASFGPTGELKVKALEGRRCE
ncbi:MAG: cellulose synthase complex periplasmic endoglucanase BcsZ [Limnobacter sp.]|uniref:cellulose synthase complex periplasmic endoglucanase BcsZ n=1 Tax=Limnobacter sp. TaxID=2003368 RepID=UPI00391A7447